MLFNSLQFVVFFAAFFCSYRAAPEPARRPLLLAASLVFYTLLAFPRTFCFSSSRRGSTGYLLRAIVHGTRPRVALGSCRSSLRSRCALSSASSSRCSRSASLLIPSFNAFPTPIPPVLRDPACPLGISFYTFQIDRATRSTSTGAASMPSAEPVPTSRCSSSSSRSSSPGRSCAPRSFLPQLARTAARHPATWPSTGCCLLVLGLCQEDRARRPPRARASIRSSADPAGDRADRAWLGVFAFAFQIYFDFSGYTDMARRARRAARASSCPITSTAPTWRASLARVLAALAHLALDAGCATTCTSRSAATGARALARTATCDHDAARRALARRELDFVVVGRLSTALLLAIEHARCGKSERTRSRCAGSARWLRRVVRHLPRSSASAGCFFRADEPRRRRDRRLTDWSPGSSRVELGALRAAQIWLLFGLRLPARVARSAVERLSSRHRPRGARAGPERGRTFCVRWWS